MPDFDRDATKEALDMWGRFGPPRPGAGTPLSDLNQIVQAARWAVQITEGDGELWAEKPCEHGFAVAHWEPGAPEACPGGSRVRVWPPVPVESPKENE